MKFISWNVNGLRAVCGKGFDQLFADFDADFVCLQETKMQAGQLDLAFDGYESFWSFADKKGYSGTATFSRFKPLAATTGMGVDEHDHEGRIVTLETDGFFLVNVYVPNSQDKLARLPYRMKWENDFLAYVKGLDQKKPVIICGDMNVAHKEIDLARPAANRHNAGFTDEERSCMSRLLESGFIDTFRYFHPDQKDIYSWWSYRFNGRQKNLGWRIDYFLVSERLTPRLRGAEILTGVFGSDHCPVALEIENQ